MITALLDSIQFNQYFLFFIDLTAIWLLIVVLLDNPKEKINKLFSLVTLSFLLWINAGYFFYFRPDLTFSLFLGRIILAEVAISFFLFYIFSINFPEHKKVNLFVFSSVTFLVGLFSYFSIFTDLIVEGIKIVNGRTQPIFGRWGQYGYYPAIFLLVGLSLYHIYKKYFHFDEKLKKKVHYFLIGTSIFLFMNLIFNVILPVARGSIQYWQLGNYSVIWFLGLTGFAIIKRDLFGIKVVAIEVLVAVMGAVLLVFPFILPNLQLKIVSAGLFLLFCIFGYYLIKAAIKEAERREEAEELAEEFRRLNKLKNQFLLTTQHHLRTPLSGIQGYLSLIKEGTYGEVPEKVDEKVNKSLKMTRELINLVNDFLDVAQFNIGEKEFDKKETNLNKLIREVLNQLEPEIKKKEIKVNFKKINNPIIESDYLKLKEALYNIIHNAIKYTKKGKVEVSLKKNNGKIFIKVEDTGIGMTEEEINKLFQNSFERGERAKKANVTGRGVGLFISSQIIEGLGGYLEAHSKGKEEGSTFKIEVPSLH